MVQAAIVLREFPGTTVVTDSVTSNGLADFITQLGGKHVRFKRGYKNVIGKGVQLNKQVTRVCGMRWTHRVVPAWDRTGTQALGAC